MHESQLGTSPAPVSSASASPKVSEKPQVNLTPIPKAEIKVDFERDSQELKAAIEFEFDLPHPGGLRLGMAEEAKEAFSKRLGITL